MAELLSTYLGVDAQKLVENDILDAVIGVDTKLFLDPYLLKSTKIPEFQESRQLILEHFADIIHLLLAFKKHNSRRAWNEARKRLVFKETAGAFIGYGVNSGDGNGIGPRLAKKLLETGLDILNMGIDDPEIFELMGLFEEDFGADRLSDMTISILRHHIYSFTDRITQAIKPGAGKIKAWEFDDKIYHLPVHPTKSNKPIIFLPKSLLRDLPVAFSRDGICHVASVNSELRSRLNKLIGKSWKDKITKSDIRHIILSDKNNLLELLTAYKNNTAKSYDFDLDPAGEVNWYAYGKKFADEHKIALPNNIHTIETLENVVDLIVSQYQKLIELNGLNKMLYVKHGTRNKPLHERYAQHLFFAVADSYCKANNLDISVEPSAGYGPVDFKISLGYELRIIVELKLSSSKRVFHGFHKQLPTYQKSENFARGYFIVIKTSTSESQIIRVAKLRNRMISEGKITPKLIIIDAVLRKSASKL